MEENVCKTYNKALVTVKNWFIAPNNHVYKAVYGDLVWEDRETIVINNVRIPKTEITTIIFSEDCVPGMTHGNWNHDVKHGFDEYETPCQIYFAEGVN